MCTPYAINSPSPTTVMTNTNNSGGYMCQQTITGSPISKESNSELIQNESQNQHRRKNIVNSEYNQYDRQDQQEQQRQKQNHQRHQQQQQQHHLTLMRHNSLNYVSHLSPSSIYRHHHHQYHQQLEKQNNEKNYPFIIDNNTQYTINLKNQQEHNNQQYNRLTITDGIECNSHSTPLSIQQQHQHQHQDNSLNYRRNFINNSNLVIHYGYNRANEYNNKISYDDYKNNDYSNQQQQELREMTSTDIYQQQQPNTINLQEHQNKQSQSQHLNPQQDQIISHQSSVQTKTENDLS